VSFRQPELSIGKYSLQRLSLSLNSAWEQLHLPLTFCILFTRKPESCTFVYRGSLLHCWYCLIWCTGIVVWLLWRGYCGSKTQPPGISVCQSEGIIHLFLCFINNYILLWKSRQFLCCSDRCIFLTVDCCSSFWPWPWFDTHQSRMVTTRTLHGPSQSAGCLLSAPFCRCLALLSWSSSSTKAPYSRHAYTPMT